MNKSNNRFVILVIKAPKNCYHCPCRCLEYEECKVLERPCEHDLFDTEGRPAWCPLIPVAEETENTLDEEKE